MTRKDFLLFVLSIIISLFVWGFLLSPHFGYIVITSLLIHEYGHFYWMDRENIKEKSMIFIPPFGAMAIAKNSWLTRGSEARIVLAGPAFGILSVLLFYSLWLCYQSDIFAASVVLASFINLFNLVIPISILDGGRIFKSVLFSINTGLGESFYTISLITIVYLTVFGYIPFFFALLIGYFAWQDKVEYFTAKDRLIDTTRLIKEYEEVNVKFKDHPMKNTVLSAYEESLKHVGYGNYDQLERTRQRLDLIINMPPMTKNEIASGLAYFTAMVIFYSSVLYYMSINYNITLYNFIKYFQ